MNFNKFIKFVSANLDLLDMDDIKYIRAGKYNLLFESLNKKYQDKKFESKKKRIEKIIVFLKEFIDDYKKSAYKYNYDKSERFEHYQYWFEFYMDNKFVSDAKKVVSDMQVKFPNKKSDVLKFDNKIKAFEVKYSQEFNKIKEVVNRSNRVKNIELLVGQGEFGEAMHESIRYLQDYPDDKKVKKYLEQIDSLKTSNVVQDIGTGNDFFQKVGMLSLSKRDSIEKSDLKQIYKKLNLFKKNKDYETALSLIKFVKEKFKIDDLNLLKYYNYFVDLKSKLQRDEQDKDYQLEVKTLLLLVKNKQYQDALAKASSILKKYPLVNKKIVTDIIKRINKEKQDILKQKDKFSIESRVEEFLQKMSSLSKKGLYTFYEKMAWFLKAKMDLKMTLQVIYYQSRDYGVKKFVKDILDGIDSGMKISEIFKWYPIISRLEVSLVKIGETTGKLGDIFQAIYKTARENEERRKQIKSVMIYPIVVISITILIFTGLLIFIVPKFTGFYGQMGMDLPLITRIMMSLSDMIITRWYFIIGFLVLCFIGLKLFKDTDVGRIVFSWLAIKMPIIKLLVHKKYVIFFAGNLALLLRSGINLLEALDLVIYGSDNLLFQEEFRRIRFELETGVNFSKAVGLGKLEDIGQYKNHYIPIDLAYSIDIGEKTGQLGDMLDDVAIRYDEDLRLLIKNMQSLLEPFIIVMLGAVVLVFVMAIFLPLINMYNVVGKMGGL